MSKNMCTQESVQAILAFLRDGSAPFIAVAAERAGVNRNTARQWLFQAEHGHTTDQLRFMFAKEVRRIRAEWMARITRELQEPADKDQAQSNKHKSWLLERVDRDLFDISQRYLPKDKQPHAQPQDGSGEPVDMNKVLSDLERPDTHPAH